MITSEPLFIVIAVLTVLWFVGWLLNKIQSKSSSYSGQSPHNGVEISPYLHVMGLNESQCNELKAILEHGDNATLVKFIAYYRPRFIELDYYIDSLRKKYLQVLNKPVEKATEIEKIAAVNRVPLDNQPHDFDFDSLTKAELRTIYDFNPGFDSALDEQFIKIFGDIDFLENFKVYTQLMKNSDGVTVFVTKKDPQRPVMEMLTANGVVRRGRRIELKDRLRILSLEQLNKMAKELKIQKIFQTHENAVNSLAQVPGSAILLAMIYSIDDLFFLHPYAVDIKAIQRELALWNSLAKLLTQKTRVPADKILLTQIH